jgi:hypothetical protein
MLERHRRAAPEALYLREETVDVKTLDEVLGSVSPSTRAFLKIDTQGYELEVLKGARELLNGRIVGVQLEMSLVPLYEGAPAYEEMLGEMTSRGFRLAWLDPGFRDPKTRELLQFDAAFVRGMPPS